MGLGHRFEEVKQMYSEVNDMLGDIVKVTPSSKMVGDLALFMVQNNLNSKNIVQRGAQLNFPDSVVSYFMGMMGQPDGGFPKDIQKVVLKGKKPITCRPGELLPPADMEVIRESLPEDFRDDASVLSACLYPQVFEEYTEFFHENGDLSSMDTSIFLRGMDPGDSIEFSIEDGKTLIIKYIGPGEINENGSQNMVFELNGAQRIVDVQVGEARIVSDDVQLINANDLSQVGASIPGIVSKVLVAEGDHVEYGQVTRRDRGDEDGDQRCRAQNRHGAKGPCLTRPERTRRTAAVRNRISLWKKERIRSFFCILFRLIYSPIKRVGPVP